MHAAQFIKINPEWCTAAATRNKRNVHSQKLASELRKRTVYSTEKELQCDERIAVMVILWFRMFCCINTNHEGVHGDYRSMYCRRRRRIRRKGRRYDDYNYNDDETVLLVLIPEAFPFLSARSMRNWNGPTAMKNKILKYNPCTTWVTDFDLTEEQTSCQSNHGSRGKSGIIKTETTKYNICSAFTFFCPVDNVNTKTFKSETH